MERNGCVIPIPGKVALNMDGETAKEMSGARRDKAVGLMAARTGMSRHLGADIGRSSRFGLFSPPSR
jgi:hypothetical protein